MSEKWPFDFVLRYDSSREDLELYHRYHHIIMDRYTPDEYVAWLCKSSRSKARVQEELDRLQELKKWTAKQETSRAVKAARTRLLNSRIQAIVMHLLHK